MRLSIQELTISVRVRRGVERVLSSPISVDVDAGEVLVVMGTSGAGKSMLLNAVAGFVTRTRHSDSGGWISSGRILIDDTDVTDGSPAARGIGLVSQDTALLDHLSVAENITLPLTTQRPRLPRRQRLERAREIAARIGMSSQLDDRAGRLSGGQRQRVAIGRLLARPRRVALLDEPLSHLDVFTRARLRRVLWDVLRDRAALGAATLWVSHDVEDARLADRVLVLSVEEGERTPARVALASTSSAEAAWDRLCREAPDLTDPVTSC